MVSARLVLMRPRNAENLGAAARAMRNFGLADWTVVAPNPKLLEDESARRLAVGAGELLEQVRVSDDLGAAVGDCTWVVGTTMRTLPGKRRLTPREVASEAVRRGGRLALVFGDERSGLRNAELRRCHDVSFIPTEPRQPSLNLAQAVLVYAYELKNAVVGEPNPAPAPAGARDEDLARVGEALRVALEASGFLHDGRRRALLALAEPLRRSRLTRAEARLWLSALTVLGKSR